MRPQGAIGSVQRCNHGDQQGKTFQSEQTA